MSIIQKYRRPSHSAHCIGISIVTTIMTQLNKEKSTPNN